MPAPPRPAVVLEIGFLDLRALSRYAGLSVRHLRNLLSHPEHPIPHLKMPKGKFMVKRAEFDAWMEQWRVEVEDRVTPVVNEVMSELGHGR